MEAEDEESKLAMEETTLPPVEDVKELLAVLRTTEFSIVETVVDALVAPSAVIMAGFCTRPDIVFRVSAVCVMEVAMVSLTAPDNTFKRYVVYADAWDVSCDVTMAAIAAVNVFTVSSLVELLAVVELSVD